MRKYLFRSHARNVTTTIEAEQIFWNGVAVVFVKANLTVAAIALLPGDVVIEDGAWKDRPEAQQQTGEQKLVN